jgi:hypothetical protein
MNQFDIHVPFIFRKGSGGGGEARELAIKLSLNELEINYCVLALKVFFDDHYSIEDDPHTFEECLEHFQKYIFQQVENSAAFSDQHNICKRVIQLVLTEKFIKFISNVPAITKIFNEIITPDPKPLIQMITHDCSQCGIIIQAGCYHCKVKYIKESIVLLQSQLEGFSSFTFRQLFVVIFMTYIDFHTMLLNYEDGALIHDIIMHQFARLIIHALSEEPNDLWKKKHNSYEEIVNALGDDFQKTSKENYSNIVESIVLSLGTRITRIGQLVKHIVSTHRGIQHNNSLTITLLYTVLVRASFESYEKRIKSTFKNRQLTIFQKPIKEMELIAMLNYFKNEKRKSDRAENRKTKPKFTTEETAQKLFNIRDDLLKEQQQHFIISKGRFADIIQKYEILDEFYENENTTDFINKIL